jgi:hypothetical protein
MERAMTEFAAFTGPICCVYWATTGAAAQAAPVPDPPLHMKIWLLRNSLETASGLNAHHT